MKIFSFRFRFRVSPQDCAEISKSHLGEMADDKEDIQVETVSDTQLAAEVAAREAEVTKLLQKKDKVNALIAALYNPPVGAKAADIKVFR